MSDSKYEERLVLEENGSTSGSDYFSDWIETSDVLTVAIAAFFPGQGFDMTVQESTDADENHLVRVQTIGTFSGNKVSGSCSLTARYFRIRVQTTNSNIYYLAVRATEVTP